MSLAYTTYLLATDPAFRRAFQANATAAIDARDLRLSLQEQHLLADLQPILAQSPARLWTILSPLGARRWGRGK